MFSLLASYKKTTPSLILTSFTKKYDNNRNNKDSSLPTPDVPMNGWIDGQTDGRMKRQIDRLTDRKTHRRMNEWTDRQTVRWPGGQTDRQPVTFRQTACDLQRI